LRGQVLPRLGASDVTEEESKMSAAQSGPAAPTAVTVPHFPITLWGYERRYVDSFVTGLVKQLERERQRSDQAERALGQLKQDVEHGRAQVPAWFSSVGTEIDQVLDNAGRAAAKLLAEAGRRIQAATDAAEIQAADRLREAEEQVRKLEETARLALADAQTERARIEEAAARAAEEQLARADHDTKALMDRAHEEAQRVQEHAASERRQLEAERQRLATLRQSTVEQLVQVYAPLGLTLVDARGQLQAPAQGNRQQEPPKPQWAAAAERDSVPQPGAATGSGAVPGPGAGPEPDVTTEHDAATDADTARDPAGQDPGADPDRGADPEPGPAAQPGVDGYAVRRLDAWAKQDDGAP
jgi:cell division septum initiation protein DivIVA